MPKRAYALVGLMKCDSSSAYSFINIISHRGVEISVNGYTLDLDMAPKDENGTVNILEIRKDNMVWASGTLFFDPSTGVYFPDQDEPPKDESTKDEKKDKKEEKKKEEKKKENNPKPKRKKKRQRRKGRVVMVDSVETVGPGNIVNIF